jgi:hypothetical protein
VTELRPAEDPDRDVLGTDRGTPRGHEPSARGTHRRLEHFAMARDPRPGRPGEPQEGRLEHHRRFVSTDGDGIPGDARDPGADRRITDFRSPRAIAGRGPALTSPDQLGDRAGTAAQISSSSGGSRDTRHPRHDYADGTCPSRGDRGRLGRPARGLSARHEAGGPPGVGLRLDASGSLDDGRGPHARGDQSGPAGRPGTRRRSGGLPPGTPSADRPAAAAAQSGG